MRPPFATLPLSLAFACFPRPDVTLCSHDDDCGPLEMCVAPVAPTQGVCKPRSDAGTPDSGASPEVIRVQRELEGYASRSNDTRSDAEPVTTDQLFSIEGTLGTFDGFRPDVDYYQLSFRRNRFLQLTLDASRPDLQVLLLKPPVGTSTTPAWSRSLRPALHSQREVFLSEDGPYFLRVEGSGDGGRDDTYAIELRELPPNLLQTADGPSRHVASLDQGGLPVFRIDVLAPRVLVAETWAHRIGRTVDTELILRQTDDRRAAPIRASSSRIDPSTLDARISMRLEPGEYQLIVDYVDPTDETLEVGIVLDSGPKEIEPNDPHAVAFINPVEGKITRTGTASDADIFVHHAQGGHLYTFEVEGSLGLVPTLEVSDQKRRRGVQRNQGSESKARVEHILAPFDQDLMARVEAAIDTSGPYVLRVSEVEREPLVLSPLSSFEAPVASPMPFSIPSGGRVWFRLPIEVVGLLTVEGLGTLDPLIELTGADGLRDLGAANQRRFRRPVRREEYWVSMGDQQGAAAQSVGLRAHVSEVKDVIRSPRDPIPLVVVPSVHRDSVSDDQPALFRLVVPTGCFDFATVQTNADDATVSLDTRLSLTSTTGAHYSVDDPAGSFAGFEGLRLPSGTYELAVESRSVTVPQRFLLATSTQVCP